MWYAKAKNDMSVYKISNLGISNGHQGLCFNPLSKVLNHVDDFLDKFFEWLLKHSVMLNPIKCVFGVISSKLLGFIISKRGIKVDPKKVTTIPSMPLPYDLKTLSLQGKIQAIRQFIAQLSDKCCPFNSLLKKGMQFDWNKGFQKAFDDIKQYFLNPHVLIPPRNAITFHLYLLATNFALGVMLAQKNDQAKEQAIYYLNHTLVDYELHYVYIERFFSHPSICNKKIETLYVEPYYLYHF